MQKKCIIAVDLGIIHNVCVTGYYQEFCVEYYMNSHEWVQTLWSPAVKVHVGAYCASQRFLKRQRDTQSLRAVFQSNYLLFKSFKMEIETRLSTNTWIKKNIKLRVSSRQTLRP